MLCSRFCSASVRRSRALLAPALLATVLGFGASAHDSHSSQGNASKDRLAPFYMLYVWDATIPGDSLATRNLLELARRMHFDTLALEASPLGYGQPGSSDRYRSFVRSAHAAGLRVFALSGYPWFTVSPRAGVPDQPTSQLEGWSVYSALVASGLFDGLVDDSSPLETDFQRADGSRGNYFWAETARASADYVEWLAGLERIAGPLPYVQAVPMWFDSDPRLSALTLEGERSAHPLSWYVARHADVSNVLAYRDNAAAILGGARGELALGSTLIGVETLDLGPELAQVTFFEEGLDAMERELAGVWRSARREPNFQGFSVHHYGSVRTLDEARARRAQVEYDSKRGAATRPNPTRPTAAAQR